MSFLFAVKKKLGSRNEIAKSEKLERSACLAKLDLAIGRPTNKNHSQLGPSCQPCLDDDDDDPKMMVMWLCTQEDSIIRR